MADLRIYDITTDDWRDATQVDLDCLQEVQNFYGQMRQAFDQNHARLLSKIKDIRERAGKPNDGPGWQVMENEPGGV